MNRMLGFLATALFLTNVSSARAAMHYVDVNSTNATPPYLTWGTAAAVIQDAVDAAVAGDEIVVTNGIYASGGRAIFGTNRVAVDKPVTLRSVNGPNFTIIQSHETPGQDNYLERPMRCVYLTNAAILCGFTLRNGVAIEGGGLFCESTNSVASNCIISANSAFFGAGVFGGKLIKCRLDANQAFGYDDNGNMVGSGGGAVGSSLNGCTLIHNSAIDTGGALSCTLNNCLVTSNSGSGVDDCLINNCAVTGNSGVGASRSALKNCTITGNNGGGVEACTLKNCICYLNTTHDKANYSYSTLVYSCTSPLPTNGVGNLSSDPQLASATHLSADSPCRGAGSISYVNGTDIDGEPWSDPPSMGCDEYYSALVTGALDVAIAAPLITVVVGQAIQFGALIEGQVSDSAWNFGDGITLSNLPYCSHAWPAPGDYAVTLCAWNKTHPGGISAPTTVHVVRQALHYVASGSVNPVAPYLTWATAARSIQDAVDAATVGGVVLVTNGTYATGGRGTGEIVATCIECVDPYFVTPVNRVVVDKPLSVLSVNGPEFTTISGNHSNRCVYLTSGASLSGFTLSGGYTEGQGGGVLCETSGAVVSNCVITDNIAYPFGGGVRGGTLFNCILIGNRTHNVYGSPDCGGGGACGATLNNCIVAGNFCASTYTVQRFTLPRGGGALSCSLNNCTVTGNWADPNYFSVGGGGFANTLNNCIVYFNKATVGPNYDDSSILNYSCTTPQPTTGLGNITNAPLLVGSNGWANLRLQPTSPCINAGNNAYVAGTTDLDGNPRVSGGTVDIGAYEFVLTPIMELDRLINLIEGADLGAGNKRPLLATLLAARSSLDRGDKTATLNQLSALHNKVRAQVAPRNLALAQQLVDATEQIFTAINQNLF